jgi:protoheme IX farnesyltransferase
LDTLGTYAELGKLRLSSMAIFAVVAGVYLGDRGDPELGLTIGTAIGTLLVAMAGSASNMLMEREFDRKMERTAGRPLPSGRVTPRAALVFAIVCTVLGLGILYFASNLLATVCCAAIIVLYVLVYTPLKRVTSLNTLVGAIPGALPPVIGYAAAAGVLDRRAMALFLIMFFWQIPHFLAIAWRYREDYALGGMKMLPVEDAGGSSTTRQMMIYTSALVVVSFLPYGLQMSGSIYLGSAICLDLLFLVITFQAAVLRWQSAMRQTFIVSIIYLPLLLAVMILDRRLF